MLQQLPYDVGTVGVFPCYFIPFPPVIFCLVLSDEQKNGKKDGDNDAYNNIACPIHTSFANIFYLKKLL